MSFDVLQQVCLAVLFSVSHFHSPATECAHVGLGLRIRSSSFALQSVLPSTGSFPRAIVRKSIPGMFYF